MATDVVWMLGGLVLAMFLGLTCVHMECHRCGRRHSTKPLFHGLLLAAIAAVVVLAHALTS